MFLQKTFKFKLPLEKVGLEKMNASHQANVESELKVIISVFSLNLVEIWAKTKKAFY